MHFEVEISFQVEQVTGGVVVWFRRSASSLAGSTRFGLSSIVGATNYKPTAANLAVHPSEVGK